MLAKDSRKDWESVANAVDSLLVTAGKGIKQLIYPALRKKSLDPELKQAPITLARALVVTYFANKKPLTYELLKKERRKLKNMYEDAQNNAWHYEIMQDLELR